MFPLPFISMANLNPAEVRHIAKLARLQLSDEEVAKFTTELTSIISYIDTLREVNTDGVEPTEQVTGLLNVTREDTVYDQPLTTPDALLSTSPLPITDHQIQTPSAHGN